MVKIYELLAISVRIAAALESLADETRQQRLLIAERRCSCVLPSLLDLLHSRVTLFTKSDSKITVELAECKEMRELFQLKQGAMSASTTSRLATHEIDFQNLDAARHSVLQKLLQTY